MSRQSVIDNSAVMIGRNLYSQGLRTYALTPYKDGNYYSDCSSFCIAALKAGGYDVPWANTYGIIDDNKNYHTVNVSIDGRHIINAASVLEVADIIVWPNHCCMVHHKDGDTVYIQDHGSGNPKIRTLYNQENISNGKIVVRRLNAFKDEKNGVKVADKQPAVQAEPTKKDTLYRVQCGAFKSRENADNHKAMIEGKGFSAFIAKKDNGLFAVQCGAYKEEANANEMADKLRVSGIDCYIYKS